MTYVRLPMRLPLMKTLTAVSLYLFSLMAHVQKFLVCKSLLWSINSCKCRKIQKSQMTIFLRMNQLTLTNALLKKLFPIFEWNSVTFMEQGAIISCPCCNSHLLIVCKDCEYYGIESSGNSLMFERGCEICYCYLPAKVLFKDSNCPKDFWKKEN